LRKRRGAYIVFGRPSGLPEVFDPVADGEDYEHAKNRPLREGRRDPETQTTAKAHKKIYKLVAAGKPRLWLSPREEGPSITRRNETRTHAEPEKTE